MLGAVLCAVACKFTMERTLGVPTSGTRADDFDTVDCIMSSCFSAFFLVCVCLCVWSCVVGLKSMGWGHIRSLLRTFNFDPESLVAAKIFVSILSVLIS